MVIFIHSYLLRYYSGFKEIYRISNDRLIYDIEKNMKASLENL